MKAISIKNTIVAVATAATLITSGIAPIATASAGPVFNPGGGKIQPITPNICATKPWICNGGIKLPPPAPLPPAPLPPAPPKPGFNVGAAAALVIGGAIAGAALAEATQPKAVQPTGNAQAHSIWCHNRYKSFRDWDNSWQPYNGPRKQCYSPYL